MNKFSSDTKNTVQINSRAGQLDEFLYIPAQAKSIILFATEPVLGRLDFKALDWPTYIKYVFRFRKGDCCFFSNKESCETLRQYLRIR